MVYENNPLEQNKAQRLANDLHRGDPQAHVDATNLLRNEFANNPRAAMDLIRVAQQQGGARGHVGVARDGTVVLQDAMGITPVGRIPTNGGNIQLEAAEVPRYNLSAGQQPYRPGSQNITRNPSSTSAEQYTTTTQAQQQQRRPITTSNPSSTSTSSEQTSTTQPQRRYPSTTNLNSTNTEYSASTTTNNINNRNNQNYGNQNYGNQNYGNQNNFRRPGVQFGIGVDLGLNNGYLNNGYGNGGDNQVVQRLTYDLRSGNQDDAANVIRNELNFNSRQAQFEMHQANINAGPNAPDHIRKLNDGTIVVTDSYSQTQEFAGRLPSAQIYADNQYNGYNQNQGYNPNQGAYNDGNYQVNPNQGNVINDGYANQGNVVNDGYANQGNVINDGNYIQDQGAIVNNGNLRNPNQGYRQNNFNQNALEIGRDMQNGRMQDAANLLRNDLRCNPQQALNEIRMANQMAQGGREFIETDNRSGNVSITDRYTHQRVSVGRLPGAQVGNYYDAGVNNGYYNNNNNNNGYYNGTNDNGYYNNNNNNNNGYNNGYNNGITPGEYLGGAAIEGGVAGLVGGLISSAFRGNRGGYQQQQQFWPPPPPRHRR